MLFSIICTTLSSDFWFWCYFVMKKMILIRRLWQDGSVIGVLSMENSKTDEQLLQMSKSWEIVGKSSIIQCDDGLMLIYYLFVYLWILCVFSLSFWHVNFGWIFIIMVCKNFPLNFSPFDILVYVTQIISETKESLLQHSVNTWYIAQTMVHT